MRARTPGVLLRPCLNVGVGGIDDGQRMSRAVGAVIPVVVVLEIVNRPADRVDQLDRLAVVGQRAGVLAGDGQARAVPGLEGGAILDHEAVPAGGQLRGGEGELDSIGESDEVEVDRLGADVGQFDVLGVGVVGIAGLGGMVHDLADPQILRHRPDREDHVVNRAPGAVEGPGPDAGRLREGDGRRVGFRMGHVDRLAGQAGVRAVEGVIDEPDGHRHGQAEARVDRPAMLVERRRIEDRVPPLRPELPQHDARPLGEVLVEQEIDLGEPVVVPGPRLGDLAVAPAGGLGDHGQVDGVLAGQQQIGRRLRASSRRR